jgi:NAD(P)-dependent dehydrogenase (short-subunit alcohol dehydrogenase family)
MPGRLGNKVALITGGASGFGAAIAVKFVLEGAKVVITDLSTKNGQRISNEQSFLFVRADVIKRSDWSWARRKTYVCMVGSISWSIMLEQLTQARYVIASNPLRTHLMYH